MLHNCLVCRFEFFSVVFISITPSIGTLCNYFFLLKLKNIYIIESISVQTTHLYISYLTIYGPLLWPPYTVIYLHISIHIFSFQFLVCYWTNSLDPTTKPEDRGLKNYCDYTLAYTAGWGCIAGIIFFVVPVLCGCCAGLFAACCSS